jgi:3-deoxy-D-manno-octulosonate 8-phosphate phosphatase (KDO 8-P phosphatase)
VTSPAATSAAQNIRLLLLDVDGVLTDGRLYYGDDGHEFKAFNIKDGLGIKLLQRGGIEVGIITARKSSLLARRCAELGIERVIQGREDKLSALNELLDRSSFDVAQVAFMGDDLPDLAVVRRVGLGMTVADGNHVLIEHALWQSQYPGGGGAVREAAEFILTAQNKLEQLVSSYL